ncbi:cache domain-containing protein [Pseudodesulfovibrio sediminis]|uniref:histidine kinase n=1 Tax=Pseudodesulfovibrio sediminis TaxID=2810563 RepID=A0ABM8I3U5_9BACT|nr:cache domain-containing protein [Pseudodesulfovibrio sediminis]BCS89157.1 hypothetical protein PSDVSF_23990 [Pseudodesulfovibrio sediminis]
MRLSFNNIRIRNKLFIAYSVAFTILFLVTGAVVYSQVRTIVRESIQAELSKTTSTIQTMVRTAADVSIKHYVRAVAEQALAETRYLYSQAQRGQISMGEAKQRAQEILLSQSIGKTGRVYCLNSKGIMLINHKRSLVGLDMSGLQFVRDQIRLKEGYFEYEWKEPLEATSRSKAIYMTYFEPWDWIITSSSFRDEFSQVVNVETFREHFFELGSGETGYPFVLDFDGTMLLHPYLENKHFTEYNHPKFSAVAKRIIEERNGFFEYDWQNPGDECERKKIVYFKEIPELRWVVASSSYYEDFQGPLDDIGFVLMIALALTLLIMIPVSMVIGALITRPIKGLQDSFAKAANGDFSVRMDAHSRDELGLLAGYFNSFMEKLTEYSDSLKTEIAVRRKTEKELIAIDKTKSMFLAMASHELRTPLTSIIGFIKLMERKFTTLFFPQLVGKAELEPHAIQFQQNLGIVQIEADRLGRLVNDLLDMSKIEAGRMEWRDESLTLETIIGRAAQAIAAYDTNKPDVSMILDVPQPEAIITVDPDRIHQVLINLLSNAFKNTNEGQITLSATVTRTGVEFSVCDTGRGIPKEDISKIFDIFYQVHDLDEHSSTVFGTGLGLSICHQIVSHYGSKLLVTSTMNEGSCFTFLIPDKP